MIDGPDFESYSKEELIGIYRRIDGKTYPDRKAKVAELLGITEEDNIPSLEPTANSKYSTFWPRFFASLIDGIFLSITGALISLPLGFFPNLLSFLNEYISPFLLLGYFVVLHGLYGQTLGKLVTSVKVVNHSDEEPISIKQAFLRDCAPLIVFSIALLTIVLSSIIDDGNISEISQLIVLFAGTFQFVWFFLEILTMLFNEKRRALHDFIAGTVVINV